MSSARARFASSVPDGSSLVADGRLPPYTGQKVYILFSYFFRIILGCLPRASYVISEILSIPIWAQGRSGLCQGPPRGVGNIMGNIKGGFPGRRPEHYGEHYGDMLRILVSSIMFPIMFPIMFWAAPCEFPLLFSPSGGAPEPPMPPCCPWERLAHQEA